MTNPVPIKLIDHLLALLPEDRSTGPDTPENRLAFIMACIQHNVPITERDVDVVNALLQYSEGFMRGAYGVAVKKTCADCHPQFIQDRKEAEEAMAKEEVWDELERHEVEWD